MEGFSCVGNILITQISCKLQFYINNLSVFSVEVVIFNIFKHLGYEFLL